MKKLLVASIAALFLATGTAYGADTCYVVQETPDNFLAMRWHPTTKSRIVWVLRPGDQVVHDPNDRIHNNAAREDALAHKVSKKNLETWIIVLTRDEPGHAREGWVYKKYLKETPCTCPNEGINGACEPP
jgi:hypothetical protein